MKTFFEHFLDELVRKQEAGEIDAEKAERWANEIRNLLQEYAHHAPNAPIVKMPIGH